MKKDIPYNSIARYITGNCSPKEAERVTKWLEESTENEQVFNDLYDIWEKTGKINELEEYDIETALNNVSQNLTRGEKKMTGTGLFIPMWTRIAAGIILIATLSYIFIFRNIESNVKILTFSSGNKMEKIKLADGSLIWLNSNSILKYPEKFGNTLRNVFLQGEAFFEIAKDPSKPFVIETPEASIKVLGTSFNVNARENSESTIVTVETGTVEFAVKVNNEKILLEKGEMAAMENQSGKLEKKILADPNNFAWKTGIFKFTNTSFKKAMDDLSKYYQRDIKIGDSTLNNQQYNAYFEKLPFEGVVSIIKMNKNLDVRDSSGVLIIVKK